MGVVIIAHNGSALAMWWHSVLRQVQMLSEKIKIYCLFYRSIQDVQPELQMIYRRS
jgi:hypothetical protein